MEEQLAGRAEPTQFGRLLAELGITPITAHSPQAKGRVERLFGTLQDRLVVELRLAGVATIVDANAFLASYLPRHNARFRVPAAQPGSAYRPLAASGRPEEVFCFKYRRVVAADNTVRLGEHRLQLRPTRQRASWARATVEVQERLDGSLAVYYQGACLAAQGAPPEAPVLRARAAHATRPRPTRPRPRPRPAPAGPRPPLAPPGPLPTACGRTSRHQGRGRTFSLNNNSSRCRDPATAPTAASPG